MKKFFFLIALAATPLLGGETISVGEELLVNGVAMESALKVAQAAGSRASLDLAGTVPETLEKYRERILANLEKYTEILYLDERQAFALTHLPPDQAIQFLRNFCSEVVLLEK